MPKINIPFGPKSNYQWIIFIPDEEIRDKIIMYTKANHELCYGIFIKNESETFENFMLKAFVWSKQPEGYEYWSNIIKLYNK